MADRWELAGTIRQQMERTTMSHRFSTPRRRLWFALLSAAVLSATALVLSPSAAAKFGGNEPCVASNGMTLDQVYRPQVSIISPDCNQLTAGKRWSPSVPWIMNKSFEQVPSGFATDWATPLDDFRGKLKKVEYVIDPGSPYKSNHSFPNDVLWVGQVPEAVGFPAVNTVSSHGALAPLPPGPHVVDVYWDLAAPHCDGFTTDQAASCLPAGETLVRQMTFDVVAPEGPAD
ncbi:MAG: hypothetical protein ACRDU5_07190 [Mycobacterium sp.]